MILKDILAFGIVVYVVLTASTLGSASDIELEHHRPI